MGIVTFSIPHTLVDELRKGLKITNFVETGTYTGNSSIWAASYFPNVYTIEISSELSEQASSRADVKSNIEFIVGNSKDELPKLVSKLKGYSLFWLDGHWCMNAGGKEAECPLMDELAAISKLQDSIILIDDARCFQGPLPPPHNSEDWPRIDEIFAFIKESFPNHTTTVIDDVIVSVPPEARDILDEYWQQTFTQRYYDITSSLQRYSVSQILKSTLKRLIT